MRMYCKRIARVLRTHCGHGCKALVFKGLGVVLLKNEFLQMGRRKNLGILCGPIREAGKGETA